MLTDTAEVIRCTVQAPARHVAARTALLALAALSALSACSTLYLAQAARGQWQVLRAREPIDRLVADPKVPAGLRTKLEHVREMRNFATRELGLPDNRSYRSYADTGRLYVVWNVVVAPEFSVEPQRWCFPIAGCVAYRGYFRERSARDFALEMRARGFDTAVGGVAAYSTLGRFADPVLNTMIDDGDDELAAIIFHELAHQLLYVPGDSEFNEAFAVTVEEAGLARWLASRGQSADLENYHARRARRGQFVALFIRRRAELRALYAQELPPALMRERKRATFAALAADIRALEARLGLRTGYEQWIADGLNNAHLATLATYFACAPGFERLLAREDGSLPRFYAAVRALANRPAHERRSMLCSPAAGVAD